MSELAIVGLEWMGTLALFLAFILLVRYLDHRERMSLIERGLLPEALGGRSGARRGHGLLRGGLITTMVGVAVTIGLYNLGYLLPPPFNAVPDQIGPWLLPGLIPTAVGFALIASYYLAPPRGDRDESGESLPHTGSASDSTTTSRPPGLRILGAPADEPERDRDETRQADQADA
jgi:hypothetical protein